MKDTIGQKVLAAVLSEQLGISVEHALKRYVRNHEVHPSWEAVGEQLLKNSLSSASGPAAMKFGRRDVGPFAGDDHK